MSLDRSGLQHRPISTQGAGLLGLAVALLRRDAALLALVRRERPDVMLGVDGVSISHVARLLGIPSVVI